MNAVARHRVVIADDEPLARERLRTLLAVHDDFEIVAECEDGVQAVEAITATRPDLLFLDIRMPGLDGLEVVDAFESDHDDGAAHRPVVVFVTAHDEYAARAFDASAADYLRKPFDRARFERALGRARERIGKPDAGSIAPELRTFLETLRRERGYPVRFLVRGAKGLYFVRTADIDWVDAQGNYVRLHAGGRAHLLRDTMKGFEEKLDPAAFVRVNRSVIVNIDHIAQAETHTHGEYEIALRDGVRVTSSRAFGARLHELLG